MQEIHVNICVKVANICRILHTIGEKVRRIGRKMLMFYVLDSK